MMLTIGDKQAGWRSDDVCVCRHGFAMHDQADDFKRNCYQCGCPLFRPVRLQPDMMTLLCFACGHTRGLHSLARKADDGQLFYAHRNPKLRHLPLVRACSCGCTDYLRQLSDAGFIAALLEEGER